MSPAARTTTAVKTTAALFAIWGLSVFALGFAQACSSKAGMSDKTGQVYYAPTGTYATVQDPVTGTRTVVRNLRPITKQ